jgi:hypothetical protein
VVCVGLALFGRDRRREDIQGDLLDLVLVILKRQPTNQPTNFGFDSAQTHTYTHTHTKRKGKKREEVTKNRMSDDRDILLLLLHGRYLLSFFAQHISFSFLSLGTHPDQYHQHFFGRIVDHRFADAWFLGFFLGSAIVVASFLLLDGSFFFDGNNL